MGEEQTSVVSFRVNIEDVVLFKQQKLLLENQQKKKITNREAFRILLEQVKNIFQRENFFFNAEQDNDFIENFLFVGKKNLKIQNPKKILIHLSEEEKKLYYDVAYSIVKKDKSTDLSYPYAFKRIVEINKELNYE